MATKINYNYEAAVTHTSLRQNERLMNKSLLRLSTGLRILSAADDASGLFIADQLSLVSTALDQGNRNIQFAISTLQIAEGSVSQIYDKLKTMYQKAVSAANDINDPNARSALQRDIENLRDAILKIAQDTEYNGIRLLNGSFNNVRIHYGARASQNISVSIASVLPQQLGGYVASDKSYSVSGAVSLGGTAGLLANNSQYAVGTGEYLEITLPDGTPVRFNDQNQLGYLYGKDIAGNDIGYIVDAAKIAETINNNPALQNYGIKAFAKNEVTASLTFDNFVKGAAGDTVRIRFYVGGEVVYDKTFDAKDETINDLNAFIADINDTTGGKLVASKDSNGTTLVLSTPNGETIAVEVQVTDGSGKTEDTTVDLAALVDVPSGADSQITDAAAPGSTGSAIRVGELHIAGNVSFSVSQSNVTADTPDLIYFQSPVSASFKSLETLNVTDNLQAQLAQVIIQSAIRQVDTIRSQIGSTIINLQSIYDAQAIAKDNTDNAESVIRNVDFAKEMSQFTKYQIRMQSGIAMLAQANTLSQLVLQLLR